MNDDPCTAKRIVIIGTSGSGKTFLGSKLAKALETKFVDLDDLHWLPGWQPRPEEDFFNCIKNELSCEKWVVSGNYTRASKYIWPQADMVIWLDFPLYHCLWRTLKRSLLRIFSREKCCNGNFETIGRLIGNDSILLWIWNTHSRRRAAYDEYFSQAADSTRFLRLVNNQEVEKFIHDVSNQKLKKNEIK